MDPDEATLDAVAGRATLRFERDLARGPEEVWRSLTEPEELEVWFPCGIVTDEWRVGAPLRFVFRADEGPDFHGTVLECDPPRLLAFTWGEETLRFELSRISGGTRLVLVDELRVSIAARSAAGWDVCLSRLEGGRVGAGTWSRRFEHYVRRFAPVLGPQEGPPATA